MDAEEEHSDSLSEQEQEISSLPEADEDSGEIDSDEGLMMQDDEPSVGSSEEEANENKPKFKTCKINTSQVPAAVLKFWKTPFEIDPTSYFKIPPSKPVPKSVCAKIITAADMVVECYDCRMDSTCIICLECFKNSNHEGHRYVVKKASGGCCDCGDPEAWKSEGFCKAHTGAFFDFNIKAPIIEQFNSVMDGVLYHYFHLIINKIQNATDYGKKIIAWLILLNNDNPYYNKLTALCLTRPLPPPYTMPEELRQRTILENLLTYDVSGKQMKEWFDLFTVMFPYYPFKSSILKHYMENFGLVVNGTENSTSCASSISCQLVTSHKLVEQYATENTVGMGQKTPIPLGNLSQLENFYYMLVHDLKCICDLIEGAPLAYWRMHLKSGIDNIFQYENIGRKWVDKNLGKNRSDTEKITRLLNFAQVENKILSLMSSLVKILPPPELQELIRQLWKRVESHAAESPEEMPIFRVEDRSLAVALFRYFDCSLGNINKDSVSELAKVLKIDGAAMEANCCNMVRRMFRAYFHYAKCMVEPGFSNTLYPYLYFYKIKSRIMSSLDILSIKIGLLIMGKPYPLSFDSITEFNHTQIETDDLENLLTQKRGYFEYSLSLISYLYISQSTEIYWAYQIDQKSNLYEPEIESLLLKIFKEKGGSVTQEELKVLKESVFHPKAKFVDQWIKSNCAVQKDKKSITILNVPADEIGLNFSDFWVNLASGDQAENPAKTEALINQPNAHIFTALWNPLTCESFKNMAQVLYPTDDHCQIFLKRLVSIYYLSEKLNSGKQHFLPIVEKFSNKVPSYIANLIGLKVEGEDENQLLLESKKKRMQELKAAKMQKFKDKQAKFQAQQSQKQIQEEPMVEKEEEGSMLCCICRNQNEDSLVYLVRLEVRDHEKLLGIGEGMECLAFSSCSHVFHHKCIDKMFKTERVIDSITCPLCKTTANMIVPLSNKPAEGEDGESSNTRCVNRIIQILFSLQEKSDLYEELMKSFYHYVLLCLTNFSHTVKRRGRQYHAIYKILVDQIESKQIDEIEKNLEQGKLNNQFESDLKEKSSTHRFGSAANFLRRLMDMGQGQEVQLQFLQTLERSQPDIFQEPPKKANTKKQANKQNKGEGTKQYSSLLAATIRFLIQSLRAAKGLPKQETKSMISEEDEAVNAFVQECFNSIIQEELPDTQISIESFYTDKRLFRSLPERYTPIGCSKECQECGELSQDQVLCLLCNWGGCRKCKESSIVIHTELKHGKVGGYLSVQKGLGCYIRSGGVVVEGPLYQDEWGNALKSSKEWDQFELNHTRLLEMEAKIKNDEIPSKSADV